MKILLEFIDKNGLVFAFLVVGLVMILAEFISRFITRNKVPTAPLAIILGLILAYIGGMLTDGKKGIADVEIFKGIGTLGGSMLRDFAIVSTAFGASIITIKKTGLLGILSLLIGITVSFILGAAIAYGFGYTDAVSITTIGAGACTYIVGPVTGEALGASSDIIALSIAAGVVKAIIVAISTPIIAKYIGLNNPETAMVYGGIIGTNAGVMAGLAATDSKLVPYGAITATFYTGLGCLLCPTVLFLLMKVVLGG